MSIFEFSLIKVRLWDVSPFSNFHFIDPDGEILTHCRTPKEFLEGKRSFIIKGYANQTAICLSIKWGNKEEG